MGGRDSLFEPRYRFEDLIEVALDEEEYGLLAQVDGSRTLYDLCTQGSARRRRQRAPALRLLGARPHPAHRRGRAAPPSGGIKIKLKSELTPTRADAMPIYEYRCEACGRGHRGHPALRRRRRSPLCPRCGGAAEEAWSPRPPSSSRATGWYVTDYARSGGGQKPAEKSAGGESAKGESAGKADGAGAADSSGKSDGAGKGESAKSGSDSAASAPAKPASKD